MEEICKWLLANWQLVLSFILAIISVIIACVRKKPINGLYGEIIDLSMSATIEAEKSSKKGFDKLSYAIQLVCNGLRERYPGIDVNDYMTLIGVIIERILDTPKKKGE